MLSNDILRSVRYILKANNNDLVRILALGNVEATAEQMCIRDRGKLGIAGTGMTPALIALVLYALLPLVRGVVVGLNQIPRDVLESARAMGMSGAQRFLHVQLPLALPVFLRSLRVVMVQTVGMAVIAALIGAGGFGALVFQGLLSSAIAVSYTHLDVYKRQFQ